MSGVLAQLPNQVIIRLSWASQVNQFGLNHHRRALTWLSFWPGLLARLGIGRSPSSGEAQANKAKAVQFGPTLGHFFFFFFFIEFSNLRLRGCVAARGRFRQGGRFESNPNLTRVKIYIILHLFFSFHLSGGFSSFFLFIFLQKKIHPFVIFNGPYLSHIGSDFHNFRIIGFVLASFTQQ